MVNYRSSKGQLDPALGKVPDDSDVLASDCNKPANNTKSNNSGDASGDASQLAAGFSASMDGSANHADFEDLWTTSQERETPNADPRLDVDVDGFEGPLDLLLDMARRQKVDLSKISILALAEQYLEFIEEVRRLRIELAADYLVMAAWLAFLKSRLLLPDPGADDDEPSGEELAEMLAHRLRRLEAMREAGRRLVDRDRLGREFFARGAPEIVVTDRKAKFSASLYDVLTAYASLRQRQSISTITIAKREVWSLSDAREILTRLIGRMDNWVPLDAFLLPYITDRSQKRSAIASSFAASLELVREGKLSIKQEAPYSPIFLKAGDRNKPVLVAEESDQ